MRGVIIAIAVALLGLGAYLAANLIPASGAFAQLENKLVDKCTRVDVFPGTEDVTIDPELNVAFVSAADRRAEASGNPVQGGIFSLSLDAGYGVRKVSLDAPADFQPHGISLWRGESGEKRLFVINHPIAGGHTVEIFDVAADGVLSFSETIAFEAMHSPNDVVAVGRREFYATNDRGYRHGLMATLEAYLALPFASVVHFNGEAGRIVKSGLVFANGINVSRDGSTIYIAELLKRRVGFYARDLQSGDLKRTRSIRVNTSPDNIEVAADGGLWVGGHSKIFDFLKHAEDARAIAPSHVIRISPRTGDVNDVFVDTSGAINGSSVGAVWDRNLVVGAVFDGHVMVCPMIEILLRAPQ